MKKEGLVQNLARSPHRLAALWFAVLAVALANCSQAPAQNVVTLVDYTNVWRYLDTGADPGPDWATTNYNDSVWPAGPGPLGVEPGVPYGYFVRIGTPLMLGSPSTPAHFFRTHFQFDPTNAGPGLEVRAELLIDDGCVIFLNGTEVGRLRVAPGQTYSNYANGFQMAEGTPEFLTIAQSTLLAGDNLLAVEIHQNNTGVCPDVFLGLRLRIGPTNVSPGSSALAILSEPLDTEVEVGNSTSLTVVNSGSPASFQWFRDGNPVANATSNTLALSNAQTNQSGLYWVVLSNSVSFIQSRVARLAVIPNLSGPRLIEGRITTLGGTTRIILTFNELLQPGSAGNTSNYLIEKLGAGTLARPTSTSYSAPGFVILGGFSSNFLSVGSSYLATVNNVRDASPATNIIAPNSQIRLIWSPTNELFGINHTWHYHASVLDDPSIETAAWFDPNYQENSFWQQGVGPFYGDLNAPTEPGTYTVIPFQLPRTLFRTSFVAPPDLPSVVSLVFSGSADSGVMLHLNGTELLRANLPVAPAPLYIYSRTILPGRVAIASIIQTTNLLHPGQTNWLTAAVHQPPSMGCVDPADMTLFFSLSLQFFNRSNVLPPPQEPEPPTLNLTRLNSSQAQLSWTGPGFALEGTTNSANPQLGPWFEVPNMANPFVLNLNQPYRLLRLRK